jgi:hypothetical protein
VPVADGVPLIVPLEAPSVKPVGKDPLTRVQVYGGSPPAPARVWLYGPLTAPLANGELVVIVRADSIVKLYCCVADNCGLLLSVALAVKLNGPVAVGVPLRVPPELSVIPAGSAPALTVHV